MTAPATTFQSKQDIPSAAPPAGTEKEVIVKRVCEVSEPDKIYRLGTVGVETRINSLFVVDAPCSHQVAHYFLLVLESTKLETHEVQERIESHCKLTTPVTALVIKKEEFTTWLHKSHPFACTVAARAELLYNSNTAPLEALPPANGKVHGKMNHEAYSQNRKRVASFLAGAELYRIRNEYPMAAFMLHQATECLLRTALHSLTGYYCHTHSLDKLFRFTSFMLWRLPAIWERHKPRSEALFQLLQSAYIEPRYRDNYTITLTQLDLLWGKVQQLKEHVNEAVINSLAQA